MEDPTEYVRTVEEERRQKDGFMAHHPESPFVDGAVAGFSGLRYFPVDIRFRVPAVLERNERAAEAFLRTNRDGELECRHVGDLRFELEGEPLRLRVYFAGERVGPRVFVPFRDATCGSESYGPGRYLTLELTEDDRYQLDFNLAFNPYCAYTDGFECGFPPAENDLPLRIPAGEMVWSKDRNPQSPSRAIRERTQEVLASRSPTPSRAAAKSPPAQRAPAATRSSRKPSRRATPPSVPAKKPRRR
ncbi:MAG TPA: DUF1684 domain-containing protein [Thermoplasmata archaeon]|nr:DUF1684 domain-containing protein [Thermoplasmata archaeon]